MDLHDEIVNDLDEAINDIFFKYQEKLGIKNGDIYFVDSFQLEDCEDSMAKVIEKILDYERYVDEQES